MSTTERIDIVVSERGAPTVSRQIAAIGDSAERSAIQTNRLKNAIYGLGAATGAIQIGRLVESYTNMANRLRVVTTSTAQLKAIQEDLFGVAKDTRTSYEANVEMFSRMSLALKDAGTSTQTLLDVTKALSQATVISGATATEAKNALVQLSQGLASGTLRGDELRAVLEQLPIVADAIAKELGVTRGGIKALAEEGKISTNVVVAAVLKQKENWEELAQKTIPTVSQGMEVVRGAFMKTIGAMDENLGASAGLARGLIWLADNMKVVSGAVVTLATALTVTLVRYALNIVIGRIIDFMALLVVGPIMSFASAINALAAAFILKSRAIGTATVALGAYLAAMSGSIIGAFGRILASIGGATAAVRGFSLTATMAGLTVSGVFSKMAAGALLLLNPLKLVQTGVGALATAITAVLGGAFKGLLASIGAAVAAFGFAFKAIASVVTIAATVGVAMVTLGDKTQIATNSTVTYKDVALAAWAQIQDGFGKLVKFVTSLWPTIGKGAQEAFGDADSAFLRFARKAASGLDFLVAAFLAAYDTILSQWRSFPAALLDLIIQAVRKAYDAVVDFMKKAYDFLKDAFIKIATLDFSGIASGGLDTQVEGAATRVGETWNEALQRRVKENNIFGNLLEDNLKRAEQISTDRLKKEKDELEALARARAEYAKTGPDNTIVPDNKGVGRKTFADYLAELQREQQLGLAVGDAYKVLNEQIEISNKLRRDLTDVEKQQVEAAVLANAQLERKRNLLAEIVGPTQEYGLQVQALQALLNEGAITLDQFNQKFYQLRENFLNGLPEATTFADGFVIQLEKMQLATRNSFGQMGTEVAKLFGPGGTLVNGIGDAIAQTIVFGKSFKDQIRQVAQSILSQLISSLVKMGLNMVMNAALGQSLMGATTASGVAQAGALTAAYTPAAAMASLATGGSNATGAATGISSIMSILASLSGSLFGAFGKGFKDGGYTGAVGKNQIAGVVHGQEFVMNAAATKRHRSILEALNAGKDPTAAAVVAPPSAPVSVSITNEIPDAAYEVRALSETDVEIIAKRIVRRETPEIVAQDLRNPNSRTSKGLSNNTTANRRR